MTMNIVKDTVSDDEELVVKKLGKPVRTTVIDKSVRIDDDDDVSSLNSGSGSSRPSGARETQQEPQAAAVKKTILGNAGPDQNGKIDWSRNPDCVDFIIQYHESSGNSNDEEGYLKTATKCFRQFNKMFSTKKQSVNLSAEDICQGLLQHYDSGDFVKEDIYPETSNVLTKEEPNPQQQIGSVPKEEYFPLNRKSVHLAEGKKVLLRGNKLEICKILGCKHICVVARTEGRIEDNAFFHAACANSDGNEILEGCPQLQEFSGKEKLAFEMFKQQFQGDELKARKFLLLTRVLYK